MFRKLNEDDRKELEALVAKEAALNLFIIGDLESYGFEESFLEYWGQFEDGLMTGVLMRYHDGFTVYAVDDLDVEDVMAIANTYAYKTIAGGKRTIDQFDTLTDQLSLKGKGQRRDMYMAKLDDSRKLLKGHLSGRIEKTRIEDLEDLQVLLENEIDEFDNTEPVERKKLHYIDGAKRGYHIKENGRIVASAETAAENSKSAMIVAVASHPNYRGKGYATAVLSKLCDELIAEDKSLCLFYDNPDAGAIYKRIGFENMDMWCVWRVED